MNAPHILANGNRRQPGYLWFHFLVRFLFLLPLLLPLPRRINSVGK